MKTYYTYLWRDPKDNTPRYVGKGQCQRVWDHIENKILYSCGRLSQTSAMLKKRSSEGYICIPTVRWFDSEAEAWEFETFLINKIGREDLGKGPLFNLTDGGDGPGGRIASASATARANLSKALKGRKKSPAHCQAISVAKLKSKYVVTDEHRLAMSKAQMGHKRSAESIKKQADALRGRKNGPLSEETKEKIRLKALGRKQSPETIEKRVSKLRGKKNPKISAALKGRPTTWVCRTNPAKTKATKIARAKERARILAESLLQ
jgi:hypothetical protein